MMMIMTMTKMIPLLMLMAIVMMRGIAIAVTGAETNTQSHRPARALGYVWRSQQKAHVESLFLSVNQAMNIFRGLV